MARAGERSGNNFYDDLRNYRAVWRQPITGRYRNHEIITMPPPSGGGVIVMEMLNILEPFALGSNSLPTSDPLNAKTSWAHSSANHLHQLAEAQKLAYADRRAYIADPDFFAGVHADAQVLTSKGHGIKRAALIGDEAADYAKVEAGLHTNHFSIIDAAGNAIAVTNSQGDPFGSGVIAPGTGFLLNNEIADWIGRAAAGFLDQPQGGARPMTNAAPTIVLRDRVPVLVLGGAGGPRTPMGIVQAIVNFVDFGHDIARALDAERIDAATITTAAKELVLEVADNDHPRIATSVQTELAQNRKHVLRRQVDNSNDEYDTLPWIEAAGVVNAATGLKRAVMDPRHLRERGQDQEDGALSQDDAIP